MYQTPQKVSKSYFQTDTKPKPTESIGYLKVKKSKVNLGHGSLPPNSISSKTQVMTPDINMDLDLISELEINKSQQKKKDIEEQDAASAQNQNKGMNFQFVSVSPNKKQTFDRITFKKFKALQEEEIRTWKGINVKFTQRPGFIEDQVTINGQQVANTHLQNSSGATVVYNENGDVTVLTNTAANSKDRKVNNNNFQEEQKQFLKIEEKRFRHLLDLLLRYRDWEEEKIKVQLMQGTGGVGEGSSQLDTQVNQGFQSSAMPHMDSFLSQNLQQQSHNISQNMKMEFINFKPLKDSSILIRDGQSTIYFQKGAILNTYMDNQTDLYFKLVRCEAKLLRAVLETNQFQQTETHDWTILWSSQSYKPYLYDNLNDYQKINHFPCSFELTRKDRLCANIVKMQERFGKEAFDIIPDTYNLPDEFADFYNHFNSLKQKLDTESQHQNQWIIKPSNSCQGKGIYIIDDISEVPIDEPCIVSKYIHNPLLINELKFDLRIYVLVTSMDPWRIYVYHEGLVRFASEEYNHQNIKSNKFAHLTNYSINKKSEKFVQNQNADQGDEGHKWSIGALNKHLEQMGVDNDLLWSKMYDVILKSFMSVDSSIQQQLKKSSCRNNCFELLGFDIMIDSNLKPWLLEVNLSPSLACDSPIDLKIKHSLFVDTMNLISIKKFDRRRDNLNKMKQRVKNIVRAKSYNQKQSSGIQKNEKTTVVQITGNGQFNESAMKNNQNVFEKLQVLHLKYKDTLRETLQENFRKGGYLRIYPSKNSNVYDHFFQNVGTKSQNSPNTSQSAQLASKISNKILHKLLYSEELIPYNNILIMKKFNRTISKMQQPQIIQNYQSQNSISRAEFQEIEENKADYSKKSYQKLSKIGVTGKLPQKNPIISSTSNHKLERQGKQQLLPALTHNSVVPQANQANSSHSANSSLVLQPQMISQNRNNSAQQTQIQTNGNQSAMKKDKLLITGDDILIEYVARLMIAVKSIKENMLKAQWIYQIEKFIKHGVWHSSDVRRAQYNNLWQRLESRLIEMKERRKRLLQSLYKKELKMIQDGQGGFSINRQSQQVELDQFHKEYKFREEQKNVVIQGFSAQQLEDMLHTSTKNVAYEVISCLIQVDSSQKDNTSGDKQQLHCKGVLTEIIKWLTITNQHQMLHEVEFSILDQITVKKDQPKSSKKKMLKTKRVEYEDTESFMGADYLVDNRNLKDLKGDLSIKMDSQTTVGQDMIDRNTIKALSSTGKKNRIIINDDIRSQLKNQTDITPEKQSLKTHQINLEADHSSDQSFNQSKSNKQLEQGNYKVKKLKSNIVTFNDELQLEKQEKATLNSDLAGKNRKQSVGKRLKQSNKNLISSINERSPNK